MSSNVSVEAEVVEQFAQVADIARDQVDLDADLFAEYGLDSVNALKLISHVEVTFDIDIDEDEARSLKTLRQVIALVDSKLR